MKTLLKSSLLSLGLLTGSLGLSAAVNADDYVIDTKGAHAYIDFKIKHLGYSWLSGRFNTFAGEFTYDESNPAASRVEVSIDTASIDSNHAERDKHLRDKDFLDVKKYPKATFVSTSFTESGQGKAEMKGNLTLHGVTRPVTLAVEHVGHGKDPWGGYRRGFAATTTIALKDFGIDFDLGPASEEVVLYLGVEGIRK
jgi:polyisoprenoid-binding protein YceI